jgi:hypothetical protein
MAGVTEGIRLRRLEAQAACHACRHQGKCAAAAMTSLLHHDDLPHRMARGETVEAEIDFIQPDVIAHQLVHRQLPLTV